MIWRFACTWAALAMLWTLGVAAANEPSAAAGKSAPVRMWRQSVAIPTYPLGAPDKTPIFYSGRKYQGAKGPVYPYAMLDKLSDKCQPKRYEAVYLEQY